jgi:uncharacterized membrane protein YkvA (DUF1232 family)
MAKRSVVKIGLWARLFRNARLLLSLLKDYWKGRYRGVSITSIVVFVLGILYVISPIDFIPDTFLGLGQIDDAAVLTFCLLMLEKDLLKYQRWKEALENDRQNR